MIKVKVHCMSDGKARRIWPAKDLKHYEIKIDCDLPPSFFSVVVEYKHW